MTSASAGQSSQSKRLASGSSPTALSFEALQERFDSRATLATSDEDSRRAAWLYLLNVHSQPIATWPRTASTQPARQREHSSESTPALTSSSSSDFSNDTTSSAPSTSDLLSSSIHQNLPLDADGWQTGFDSAILQQQEGAGGSGGATSSPINGAEKWQTAQSKRARRRKGRGTAVAADAEESSTAEDATTSSLFNSVVDLENERSRGRLNGTAHNGNSVTGFFSELSVEGGEMRKNKSKKKSGPTSSPAGKGDEQHKGQPTTSGEAVDSSVRTENEPYKLPATFSEHLPAHRDERQVELDILRSFVGLAASRGLISNPTRRDARRRQLQDLVIGTLRRYPFLNYYQGYHDVVSVLLLTLSPNDPPCEPTSSAVWASREDFDLVLTATSRLTLYYLRDFMAPKMDPCLGWLKCLRNMVRATDEDFSRDTVEQASALPYFALSWIITCLAHELPIDAEESRVVFDFILLQGPRGILYILAALLVTQGRKVLKEQQQDEDADDPAMLHHAFSKLPAEIRTAAKDERQADAMDQVLTEAKRIAAATNASDPTKGVMGSSSVLQTWQSIAGLSSDGASAATWKKRDTEAASYLSDPQSVSQIVLDPHPTPPPSDVGEDEKAPRRPSQGGKRTIGNTSTALFVSVLFIAGMAVLIGPAGLITTTTGGSSTSFTQKSKLVNDLTQLGKGLAGLALCAAGAC